MWNIIKADMFRISRGKGLYVCIGVIILLLSVSIYLKTPGHIGMQGGMYSSETALQEPDASMEEIREHTPDQKMQLDIDIASAGGNLYYVFLPVVFMVLCSDLTNHTTKNVISTEVSRSTYYLAKLVLTLMIGFVFILLHNYGAYFGSLLFNGSSSVTNLLNVTIVTLRQLPIYCGIISVLVMLACICRKAAVFNGIAIPLVMAVQLLISLVSFLLKMDPNLLYKFEFEAILRSLSVVGSIPMETLLIGIFTGIGLFAATLIVGCKYFNTCNIE